MVRRVITFITAAGLVGLSSEATSSYESNLFLVVAMVFVSITFAQTRKGLLYWLGGFACLAGFVYLIMQLQYFIVYIAIGAIIIFAILWLYTIVKNIIEYYTKAKTKI